MYLRTTPRKNKDGSVVRYLQLAHNTWDPVAKRSRAQVIYNFGREETANRAALTRLIASVTRFLEPDAALAAGAGEGLAFLEALPEGVKHVGASEGTRLEEGQPLAGAGGQGGVGLEKAGHRGDEARHRGPVGSVLSAEVVDHLGTGALGHRVPRVVGQLQVADYRAILVLPRSGSQVHRLDNLTDTPETQHLLGRTCIYDIPGFCPGLRLLSRAYMPECTPEPRLAAEPRSEGDLLVAMTEQAAGLVGSPIRVPESGKFLHNQRLGLVTRKSGVPWINEFFFYVFNVHAVRAAIHDGASGVKVRHTSPTKIGAVVVTFPTSLAEQRQIVSALEDIETEIRRLQSTAQRKLTALDDLKKSLLRAAFSQTL